MSKLRQFDPTDDADAVADLARREVAGAALRVVKSRRYRKANPRDQFEGMMHGIMTGALGTIAMTTIPGSEAEVRAILLKHLPYYFDRALEIGGRKPLGDIH
ncbi:hypothetical protein FJ422_30735 [Mesorhizobium sp. B2-6-3]|uniref:hypothetical protein n=1 Tax=Mesorhizobium sp. B2-6-3 TaxID=2589914 RepID=UPI00112C24F9|nr:hypothetical protein [Mesorhizobium sp. B2-6-3]TPJ75799.1 hypothetical protein FJ422_30735 [Mesorhizobium sp. B2-6-3]